MREKGEMCVLNIPLVIEFSYSPLPTHMLAPNLVYFINEFYGSWALEFLGSKLGNGSFASQSHAKDDN